MKKEFSLLEAKEKIKKFFLNISEKNPKEIKKIKKLAMQYNISLKEKRKLFCGKCYSAYRDSKIRIKNGNKIIVCKKCGNIQRFKLF